MTSNLSETPNNRQRAALVIADTIEMEGGNAALMADLGITSDMIAEALADAGLLTTEQGDQA